MGMYDWRLSESKMWFWRVVRVAMCSLLLRVVLVSVVGLF